MIIVQIPDDAEGECLACNWPQTLLYVTALEEDAGYQFYQQSGGLCAECLLARLFEENSVLEVHEDGSL